MKFFTRSWCDGDMSDADAEGVQQRYQDHLARIVPRLSDPVRRLATEVNVHDGLIRRIQFDPSSKTLCLELRCGDLQVGYFDLDLVYGEATLTPDDLDRLDRLASDAEAEALYDEVDILGDAYSHRILFWPSLEVEIEFRALTLQVTPRPNREIVRQGFLGTPHTD